MVHSGPWSKLPPAPSPFTPPGSSALPRRIGWFRPRVTPTNPFGEGDEDANSKAGQQAKKPANQANPCEPVIESRNDSSPAEEKLDIQGKPSSRDNANAASVSDANCKASSFDDPAPSETSSPPPSTRTDGSSEGLGNDPKLGLASGPELLQMAPTSMDLSNIPGLGSLTGDGPLSGLAEEANPLGSLNLPGPGAMGAVANIAGGLGGPDLETLGSLGGLASGVMPPDLASFGGQCSFPDIGSGHGVSGLPDVGNAVGDLAIGGGADMAGGLEVPMSLAGLASGLGVPGVPDIAGQATSMDLSNISGLDVLSMVGLSSGLAEGVNPLGSLKAGAIGGIADMSGRLGVPDLADGLGVPDLAELGSLGSLATSVVPPDLSSFGGLGSLADIGSGLGVPGVADIGDCPAVGGLMESACPGASVAAPGLSSIPKSFSGPASSSALKKGQTTPSHSESCNADKKPNAKPTIPKSKTSQGSSRRLQAPGYGFPPIKRTVRTDACIPTDDLQGELGEVNKRLEEVELCSRQLENNLRDCTNKKEEEAMLTDWMALIQEKEALVRRDAEITHLTKQKTLEERQADLEYQLRCLLIKPESEWSVEERAQEQKMLEQLVTAVGQRNDIVSSLDEDRQREKEEDSVLGAMQEKEFQKKGLQELKKSKGQFKHMKVFRMLSTKATQEPTQKSKDKKN
ncbi:hypothetical protein NHX12_032541 [Muraenolepis orangiensis]|uniref:BMERB domain-containing protein n=1 Tax=Muraenolepis orangiensis TaxID=630683 RepID=A0A9Q0IKR6_9TELE|nr:hypothetical protein NHX12_032541 [Muraenolepis orangiensis]